MAQKNQVTVIIVNYNTGQLLMKCLEALVEKTKGVRYDIIVVDNGSGDDSIIPVMKKFRSRMKFILLKNNRGFGAGNNAALHEASSKYVFLLNPDTELISNALKILHDFMETEKNADVGCCGGSLYDEFLKPAEVSYGNFPSIRQVAFEHFGLSRIFKKYHKKHMSICGRNYDDAIKEVPFITGADMFIRSEVLKEVGFFDEDFFLYYEDTELSYRIHKAGYRSVLVPEAKIIHHCGISSKTMNNVNKILISKKSEYLFFEKCYGTWSKKIIKLMNIYGYLLKFLFSFNSDYLLLMRKIINL